MKLLFKEWCPGSDFSWNWGSFSCTLKVIFLWICLYILSCIKSVNFTQGLCLLVRDVFITVITNQMPKHFRSKSAQIFFKMFRVSLSFHLPVRIKLSHFLKRRPFILLFLIWKRFQILKILAKFFNKILSKFTFIISRGI